ncbi:MAG: type II toxin-antitoxin system VapC family toxin [Blastocatellia bacterium]
MRYYLDTVPIIYTVETSPLYFARVDAILALPGLVQVTSEMARLECRIKPTRDGNLTLLQDFDDYLASTITEIVPTTREVIDRATEIRAQFNFKTPDSIHLAAAVVSNCDVFLTNDHRLNRFTGISVQVV